MRPQTEFDCQDVIAAACGGTAAAFGGKMVTTLVTPEVPLTLNTCSFGSKLI